MVGPLQSGVLATIGMAVTAAMVLSVHMKIDFLQSREKTEYEHLHKGLATMAGMRSSTELDLLGQLKTLQLKVNMMEQRLGTTLKEQAQALEDLRNVDGQPLRLLKLSDRPEIRRAIELRIENGTKEARWIQQRTLPPEHPAFWRQRTFKPHGAYSFIQYSGYRAGSASFAVVGLAAQALRDKRELQGCRWADRDGEHISGSLNIHYEGWPFDLLYETVVLECTLDKSTGARGGILIVHLDYEEFVALREEPSKIPLDPAGPFLHQVAFCSAGLHDAMIAQHVFEWVEFHRLVHGIDHFYFYDAGGVGPEMLGMLQPYIHSGLATLSDLREALLFSVKLWGQPLAILDCIQRARYSAKWLFMGDTDEYLHVTPPESLQSLLQHYEGKAWITHGCVIYNISFCEPVGGANHWAIERVLYREKEPHCERKPEVADQPSEMCLQVFGHRKYFLDPRQVWAAGTHDVKGVKEGVDLNATSEMKHFHYRGLGSVYDVNTMMCKQTFSNGKSPDLERSEEVAQLAKLLKMCPIGTGKECFTKMLQRYPLPEDDPIPTSTMDQAQEDKDVKEQRNGEAVDVAEEGAKMDGNKVVEAVVEEKEAADVEKEGGP